MKKAFMIVILALVTVVPAMAQVPAQQPCDSAGQNMQQTLFCKAFDGSVGNLASLRVCENSQIFALLLTANDGRTSVVNQTDSRQNGSTFTYIAAEYSLEVPAKSVPNGVFDAVFKAAQVNIPMVCNTNP